MDDLILLNKAAIMSPEISTLNMIEKAKSKFEDEQLKRIASVASPQSEVTTTQMSYLLNINK